MSSEEIYRFDDPDEAPIRTPHNPDVNLNPAPGSIIRKGDMLGYTESGDLLHVESETRDVSEMELEWFDRESNGDYALQIAWVHNPESRHKCAISGLEAYELARDQCETKPDRLVDNQGEYAQVKWLNESDLPPEPQYRS